MEILIAAQGKQLEKIPSPPHSDAPLPDTDSHVLDHPSSVKLWSFYPCSDCRVDVSRLKKLCRPRQHTTPRAPPISTGYTNNNFNFPSNMPSPLSSPSPELKDEGSASAESQDSSDASAVSPETAGNNRNDSNILQPQNLGRLKNSSAENESRPLSSPSTCPRD